MTSNPEHIQPQPFSEEPYVAEELSPKKELYRLNCIAITISGRPGSGQSTAAKKLGELLKIKVEGAGTFFRESEEKEVVGFPEREIDRDRRLDAFQANLLKDATNQNPIILDGKVASTIANELRREDPSQFAKNQKIVSVFVTCPRDKRYHRILKRQREKAQGRIDKLNSLNSEMEDVLQRVLKDKKGKSGKLYKKMAEAERRRALFMIAESEADLMRLSVKNIAEETRSREKGDINQWKKIHPQLEEFDPFDPNAKDRNGNRIYTIVVSSAKQGPKEVAEEIIEKLIEIGGIEKINDNAPRQGIIYEAS